MSAPGIPVRRAGGDARETGSWGQDLGGFGGHASAAAAAAAAEAEGSPDAVRPRASQTPSPLRVSSRATHRVVRDVPPSAQAHGLFILAEEFRIPSQLVTKLLKALGAADDTTMEDFGFLTVPELEAAVDIMADATGTECSSLERSKLRRFHLRAGQLARIPPPVPAVVAPPVPRW